MRAVLYAVALMGLSGCDGDGGGPGAGVRRRLEAGVASGAATFDFAAVPFAWDRLHVFGPYTSRAVVERALGFPWPEFRRTTIEQSDTVCLVIFVRGGAVTAWYEQPRSVELGDLANGAGYGRGEVVFTIDRDGGRVSLLRPRR